MTAKDLDAWLESIAVPKDQPLSGHCVADKRWCDGYADGSGEDCRRARGACVCAEELVEVHRE